MLLLAIPGLAGERSTAVEETLLRNEYAWGKAMVDRDYAKVDEILDDEWAGLDPHGKPIAKARFMADLKAGSTLTTAVEYGPIKVRLYKGFAIVTGSNTETAVFQGKNTTGEYAWIDVHINRNGRWRILSSQYTKLR